MDNLLRRTLLGQYEASLAMLYGVIDACPDDAWEALLANATARWAAYHALVFTDVYLGESEPAFEPHDFYREGGDELRILAVGLPRARTLQYLHYCREKARRVLAAETADTLAAADGFGRGMTRCEMHIYNIRHIQHHTAQLSTHVRRWLPNLSHSAMDWVGTGWRITAGQGASLID